MSTLADLGDIIDKTKEITKELKIDTNLKGMTNELQTGVEKTVDKVASYVIKAMPIPDFAKNVLIDVKDALKTKDLKTILSTAVNSSIREGLELLGLDTKTIKNVFSLKDIATKGGLAVNLKNAIDIISNKYLKNNLIGNNLYNFFERVKDFVLSNKFMEKLNDILKKLVEKKDKFMEQVKKWYSSYESMNLEEMNSIAVKLNRKKEIIEQYSECAKQNGIIQNIVKMTNNKNEKLSAMQLQLCSTL